jgi:hypothetical protein
MPPEPPNFDALTRWFARTRRASENSSLAHSSVLSAGPDATKYQSVLSAARAARDEFLRTRQEAHGEQPHFEVLQLLAAADKSDEFRPPEMVTARGFRVTLAYDAGDSATSASSICVLVRCPPELIAAVQGKAAFLWNGSKRFELGQFDADGKAIGTLPADIEISLSDFAVGRVKLEEPPSTDV